ncbi:bifunctional phosphoribosylaminoimidazolecarboxamide formyltransferase/IMP cyclohydrolase [Sporanaerobacter sp. PP17-6a]|uniref:bifunctional phosphoribosylaminoimidazolecarboxamide formyltransferase/IMP cyclohydrolase n=1 Tax=Sporanaerobacter sp. PP17-6a TaxID=1891289 RepID=UPI0008A019AA|nr:bifunctional phosphoribosylaminoimidazolecarboxamide formyltransferase/IMP cyclohydrolase [Sporanaerobacter sp. PP17-6a]SCL88246.1 Bifunctional purine biosynthesis protein PurH [Sporanaerobacter sp. PP17-6a]
MKRALISVYDKKGIIEFAKKLSDMGWEIISTGGTSRILSGSGLKVTDVSDVTGFPECFNGRVKTLHPKIHGGILALRDDENHLKTMKELGIKPIDMVVNNLYPFKETLLKAESTHEDIIENIDIGGPSMLRAAAKNYKFVTVIVDPKDYNTIIDELENKGEVSYKTREYLAAKVFQHTSNYDALISHYFNKKTNIKFPDTVTLTFEKKQDLRYGENPHQEAAFYTEELETTGTLSEAVKLHGKELSYNNIGDGNGALEILKEFTLPTVVAVKHANPCGVGSGKNIAEAFKKAYESDKQSIFGGIIAANDEIDVDTAKMIKDIFIEVVIAPSYSESALKILEAKKNIRLLRLPHINYNKYSTYDMKKVLGGVLLQDRNQGKMYEDLKIVTQRKPSDEELKDLLFAWKVVKNTKSNAIVLAKNQGTVAVGPGQVSRIWALENAIRQGEESVRGSVMASDAFFPFSDCIEAAAKAGITAVIQPGGSVRDKDSIDMADKYKISMLFTGMRHFKH